MGVCKQSEYHLTTFSSPHYKPLHTNMSSQAQPQLHQSLKRPCSRPNPSQGPLIGTQSLHTCVLTQRGCGEAVGAVECTTLGSRTIELVRWIGKGVDVDMCACKSSGVMNG